MSAYSTWKNHTDIYLARIFHGFLKIAAYRVR